MNTITVFGRLCSDVTTNEVSGRTVANFRIATKTRRKNKETNDYIDNFYNVSAWGTIGETAAKFYHNGNRACVSGELVLRPYKASDGSQRMAVEIDATSLDLVETKAESEAKTNAHVAQAAPATAPAQNFASVELDDSLPF